MAYEDGTLTQEEKDALAKDSASNQGFIYSANDRAKAINSPVSAPVTSLSPRVSEQGFVGNMADSVGPALYTVGSGLIGAVKGSYRALGGENRSEERIRINRERKDANAPLNIPAAPAQNAKLVDDGVPAVNPSSVLAPEAPGMTPAPTAATPVAMPVQSSMAGNQNAVKAFNPTSWKNNEGKLQNNYFTNVAGDTGAGNADMKSGGIQMSGGVLPYVSDRSVSDYMSPDGTIQTKDFQSALGAAKTPAEKALVMASSKLAQAKSAASGGYDLTPGAFLAAKGELANAEKEYQAAVAGMGSSGKVGENMALAAFQNQLGMQRDEARAVAQDARDINKEAANAKGRTPEERAKNRISEFDAKGDVLGSLGAQRELLGLNPSSRIGKVTKTVDANGMPITVHEDSPYDVIDKKFKQAEKEKKTADLLGNTAQLASLRADVQKISPEFQKMIADKNLRKAYDNDPKGGKDKPPSDVNFKRWVLYEKLAKDKDQHVADIMARELGI